MDETTVRNVIEAALLAAGGPVSLDKLVDVFASRGAELGKPALKDALGALGKEYESRGIEVKEVASGYRIQIKSSARDWLQPLFEERAPRYTRALLETLALIAYRQPITRAEIEEVRGVAVSSNIVRTLIERGWIRVVGFRDVPGKPSMLGTTREFLDYFGLRKLDDLPTLAEIKDTFGTMSPQEDFLETLEAVAREQTRARVENAIDDSADDGAQVADASNGREVDEGERAAAAWKATAAFGAGVTEADVDATDEGQEADEADEGAFAGDSSAVADDEATVADDGGMIADGAGGREPAASAAVDVRRGPTTSATDDERGGRGPTTSAADDERGGHGPAASAADDERGGHGPAASAADDERGPPGDEAHESRRAAADDPRNGVTDDFDGDASAVSNVVPLTQSETH